MHRVLVEASASMGPRLGSRGDRTRFEALKQADKASMGPRLGSRGDGAIAYDSRILRWLQWGHGLGAVETAWGTACLPHTLQLQWGHGLGAVETHIPATLLTAVEVASMGPRLGSRGDRLIEPPPLLA